MSFEEPKVEFVPIDLNNELNTTNASGCIEDGNSNQGGTSCIGNAEHSQGGGCDDTAPLVI